MNEISMVGRYKRQRSRRTCEPVKKANQNHRVCICVF